MRGNVQWNIVWAMRSLRWIYVLPLLLLLVVTLPHLGQGDFRTDTARYAAVGLQAWRIPSVFWTPHLQPEVPYFNKPPLVVWIHGAFLHWFGVDVAVARVPSILAALIVVVLTVQMARRWFGRGMALVSGCVLALTYEFFRRTREISLDMWQLAFMLAGVALYLRSAANRRAGVAWLAGAVIGLALMCKPFMALLVIPWLLVVCSRLRLVVALLLGIVVVALPWHWAMWAIHGEAFAAQYLGREVVERARGLLNREPWWYYAAEMGRSYWPWWLALGAGVWRLLRRGICSERRRKGLLLVLGWVVMWALVLSIFPDKRPRYELPLYPAMAVIAGYGVAGLPWRGLRRWYRRWLPVTAGLAAGIGILVALLPVKVQAPPDRDLKALMDWCGAQPGEVFYSGALSTNDEGYFYLKMGRWPARVPAGGRKHVPARSFLIYTDELKPLPGRQENVVFQSGAYRVTQR